MASGSSRSWVSTLGVELRYVSLVSNVYSAYQPLLPRSAATAAVAAAAATALLLLPPPPPLPSQPQTAATAATAAAAAAAAAFVTHAFGSSTGVPTCLCVGVQICAHTCEFAALCRRNAWACDVNETLMRNTIDAFVALGLRDAGFEYVSMDGERTKPHRCLLPGAWCLALVPGAAGCCRALPCAAACFFLSPFHDRRLARRLADCWASGCRITDNGSGRPAEPGIGNCTLANQLGRHPNGTIIPNPVKFSGGVKALADYAHQRGLKFGLCESII